MVELSKATRDWNTVWNSLTAEERKEYKALGNGSQAQKDFLAEKLAGAKITPAPKVPKQLPSVPLITPPPGDEFLPVVSKEVLPTNAASLGLKGEGKFTEKPIPSNFSSTHAPAPASVKPTVAGVATGDLTANIKNAAKALPEFSQKELVAGITALKTEVEQRGVHASSSLLKRIAKSNPAIAAAIAAGAATVGGVAAWLNSRKAPEAAAKAETTTNITAPAAAPAAPAAPVSAFDDPDKIMAKLTSMKNPGEAPVSGMSTTDWNAKIKDIEDKYERQKDRASVGELAATLGQAIGLMIAGGLGQGGPQSSHGAGAYAAELLKRPAPDFSKEYDRAATEKESRLSQVDKARALEAEQLAAEDRRKLAIWQSDKSAYANSLEGRNRAILDLARINADRAEKAATKDASQAGTILDKQRQVDKDMAPIFQLVGQLQDPKADKKGIVGKVRGALYSMGIKNPEKDGIIFKSYDADEVNAALEALTRVSEAKKSAIAEARGGGVVAPQTQASDDKFVVGKAYTSNGITKTYLGNGQWK